MYRPLEKHEAELLSFLFAMHGNRTKTKIRDAWMNGDYSALGLKDGQNSTLQFLRNSLGPSWLCDLKLRSLDAVKGGAV